MQSQEREYESQFHRLSLSMEILDSVDDRLLDNSSIESLIKIAIDSLQSFIGCDRIKLHIFDRFYVDSWVGLVSPDNPELSITKRASPPTESLIVENQPITIIDDLSTFHQPDSSLPEQNRNGALSWLHAQLVMQGKIVGFIDLGNKSAHYFTPEHQRFVGSLVLRLNSGLRYLRLFEEMEEHGYELENAIFEYIQAHEEIQKREISYQSIVEDQTELICRYDSEFHLTFVNHAYAAFYDKQPDELIGTNLLEHIPIEEREPAISNIQRLNATHPLSDSEHQSIMPDGSRRWYQWRDRALLDARGSIIEYQGVGRDVTAQMLLQKEQQKHALYVEQTQQFLQATLDALPSSIVVLDEQGTIISINASWKQFAEANGTQSEKFYYGDNYLQVCDEVIGVEQKTAALVAQGIRDVISGRQKEFSLEYACHSPTEHRWFAMIVTPFAGSAPHQVVVAHLDISSLKQAQNAFHEEAKRVIVLQKEQELDTLKNKMMVRISHEFRTPLAIISTSCYLLERQLAQLAAEQSQVLSQRIRKSINNITDMLNDMAIVIQDSKNEGALYAPTIGLETLCQIVIDKMQMEMSPSAPHHLFILNIQDGYSPVRVNQVAVDTILTKLLSNAMVYSPAKNPIRVDIESRDISNGTEAIIRVTDQGIGIYEDDLGHIFEPFYRGHNINETGGIGLGLTIAKKAADAIEATIEVESEPRQGTTMTIRLPINSAP